MASAERSESSSELNKIWSTGRSWSRGAYGYPAHQRQTTSNKNGQYSCTSSSASVRLPPSWDDNDPRMVRLELLRLLHVMEAQHQPNVYNDDGGGVGVTTPPAQHLWTTSNLRARADRVNALWDHLLISETSTSATFRHNDDTMSSLERRVRSAVQNALVQAQNVESPPCDSSSKKEVRDENDDDHILRSLFGPDDPIQSPSPPAVPSQADTKLRKPPPPPSSKNRGAIPVSSVDDDDDDDHKNDVIITGAAAPAARTTDGAWSSSHQSHDQSLTSPTTSSSNVRDLQDAQRQQIEEAIAGMAEALKAQTSHIHQTLQSQNAQLHVMEDLAEHTVEQLSDVARDVKRNVSQGWRRTIGTWSLLLTIAGAFAGTFLAILAVPKRRDRPCLWRCPRPPPVVVVDDTRFCRTVHGRIECVEDLPPTRLPDDDEPPTLSRSLQGDDPMTGAKAGDAVGECEMSLDGSCVGGPVPTADLVVAEAKTAASGDSNDGERLSSHPDDHPAIPDSEPFDRPSDDGGVQQAVDDSVYVDYEERDGNAEADGPDRMWDDPSDRVIAEQVDDTRVPPGEETVSVGTDAPVPELHDVSNDKYDEGWIVPPPPDEDEVLREYLENYEAAREKEDWNGGDVSEDEASWDDTEEEGSLAQHNPSSEWDGDDGYDDLVIPNPDDVLKEYMENYQAVLGQEMPAAMHGNRDSHETLEVEETVQARENPGVEVGHDSINQDERVDDPRSKEDEFSSFAADKIKSENAPKDGAGSTLTDFKPTSNGVPVFNGKPFSPRDVRKAAATGDAALLEGYLSAMPEWVDKADKNGWTSLHLAARAGFSDVVRLLLNFNCNVDAQTSSGDTALGITVQRLGSEHPVAKLLQTWSSRDSGSSEHDSNTAQEIPRFNLEDFHKAVANDQIDEVRHMIQMEPGVVNQQDANLWTSLHTAASTGSVPMVRLLLDHGGNADLRTSDGQSPRDLAIELSGDSHPFVGLL